MKIPIGITISIIVSLIILLLLTIISYIIAITPIEDTGHSKNTQQGTGGGNN